LSSTTPLAVFTVGGWYPKATRGDFERACAIASLERGMADGIFLRWPLLGRLPLGGKKCLSSAWLILTGSEASGREGTLGVFLVATGCLAVQMLLGEVWRGSRPSMRR